MKTLFLFVTACVTAQSTEPEVASKGELIF